MKGRNAGLDLMRAIAILMVLISHTRHHFESYFSEQGVTMLAFGYLGVEIFFVLSGFLIGGILLSIFNGDSEWHDIWNFWKRRWFRTLPNYYLCLAICIVALFVLGKGDKLYGNLHVIGQYLIFVQNLYYEREDWFYSVSWSLAVEEWFYILSPLVLFFCSRVLSNIGHKYYTLFAILLIMANSISKCKRAAKMS